jgi:hypothetical protein
VPDTSFHYYIDANRNVLVVVDKRKEPETTEEYIIFPNGKFTIRVDEHLYLTLIEKYEEQGGKMAKFVKTFILNSLRYKTTDPALTASKKA